MKKWSILLGLIVIILIGGYLGLSYYGVKLVQPQLQKMLGPGFTLKEIQVRLTHLSMKGIQLGLENSLLICPENSSQGNPDRICSICRIVICDFRGSKAGQSTSGKNPAIV